MFISKKLVTIGAVLAAITASALGGVTAANAAPPADTGDSGLAVPGPGETLPDGIEVVLNEDGSMHIRVLSEDEIKSTDWLPVDD